MPNDPQNVAIVAVAKGSTARLRSIIESDVSNERREVARLIFDEIRNIEHTIVVKYEFKSNRPKKEIGE